eukprot:1144941-Pelagomonas_calceolata.AAC.1
MPLPDTTSQAVPSPAAFTSGSSVPSMPPRKIHCSSTYHTIHSMHCSTPFQSCPCPTGPAGQYPHLRPSHPAAASPACHCR